MVSIGGMKLGKQENPETTPKFLTVPATIDLLATPTLEFGTPIGTDKTRDLTARKLGLLLLLKKKQLIQQVTNAMVLPSRKYGCHLKSNAHDIFVLTPLFL